jgi:hypothetical protein
LKSKAHTKTPEVRERERKEERERQRLDFQSFVKIQRVAKGANNLVSLRVRLRLGLIQFLVFVKAQ